MDNELKKLEVELAKVRLAKEQLELRDALKRAERRQNLAGGAERIVAAGVSVARSAAIGIADKTPRTPVAWRHVFTQLAVAAALFIIYVIGLPDSKNNLLLVAFFASVAFAGYGTFLFTKKVFQVVFH